MAERLLARDKLWDVALSKLGFVTSRDATDLGIERDALQMLVQRGTLLRVAHGVYRFPQYPVSQYDPYMLAVLWTGVPEACLSHETALDAYGISGINPNTIHVTVAKNRRIRRAGGETYVVHYEDLLPAQIGWWQEIPTVTAVTAVGQCIRYGTPTYLMREAITNGHARGYLTTIERDELSQQFEVRDGEYASAW